MNVFKQDLFWVPQKNNDNKIMYLLCHISLVINIFSIHGYIFTWQCALWRHFEVISKQMSFSFDRRTGLYMWFYLNFLKKSEKTKQTDTISVLEKHISLYISITYLMLKNIVLSLVRTITACQTKVSFCAMTS